MERLKSEWFGNIKGDLLAGIVVCMALIPEAIGFSIVAGVDPMVGVYASFCISLVTSIFGGRPGLISAAAGATALVLASLVKDYGVEYLFAATILTGILQVIFAYLKIGSLMKFIPKPVMTGFVNALGILMFTSQIQHFEDGGILFILAIIGIGIIYLLPKITKVVPSPIVAIAAITIIVSIFKLDVKTLGDMGRITTDLPIFKIPSVPLNLETLKIIFPYALSVSLVGIVESLLTSQLVDEITDTNSNKDKECFGQGLANVVAGFFGGIAGCGMIGQTIINVNYGGRGRLSTLTAGVAMLFSVILLNKFVVQIPLISLASVMVVVSISTFNWESIKNIKKIDISETIVMLSTVIIVLLTHNLAYGVVVGIIVNSIIFVSKISDINVGRREYTESLTYIVEGQLFFASTTKFVDSFNYDESFRDVSIDFSNTRVWDESAKEAIEKVIAKYKKNNVNVAILGLENNKSLAISK